jgi:GT2 family glycosyltransferase
MPKVAIVIINYNGLQYLPDCLHSLASLKYSREDFKVFFGDNASSDASVEYVKNNFPQIEVSVNDKNLGFAAANNLLMEKALNSGFDYVFLLNQDTICQSDVLDILISEMEKDLSIGSIQPRLMLWPEKNKVNSLGNSLHYLGFGFSAGGYQEFDGRFELRETAYASGAAVIYRSQALKKTGLFDPDFFMYHEDMDLGWKLRLCGYKNMVALDAVIYHKYSFSKSMKKYYFMERNRYICLLENYNLFTFLLILPALLAMELGLFVFSFFNGFWREKLKVYAYFFKVKNWQKIMVNRKFKQNLRTIKDKDIVRLFCGRIQFQEIDNPILKYVANPVFNAYWQIVKFLIRW